VLDALADPLFVSRRVFSSTKSPLVKRDVRTNAVPAPREAPRAVAIRPLTKRSFAYCRHHRQLRDPVDEVLTLGGSGSAHSVATRATGTDV
jgi:hypothetical protein